MTSKHCFFKVMREDFRHKVWMLVLSILGNVLAITVVYLMTAGASNGYWRDSNNECVGGIRMLGDFFAVGLPTAAGFVAVCGAMIVGFASFRYLFHKSMVDTFHGIPVKRRTLFAATWLNGFLIWLIPFLTMSLVTLLLGVIRLSSLREELLAMPQFPMVLETLGKGSAYLVEHLTEGQLLLTALQSMGILVIVFLLIYNLCLAAVMLSGNALNMLSLTAIFGVGAIAVYGLMVAFCGVYLDSFLMETADAGRFAAYASPLASSIGLLVLKVKNGYGEGGGLLVPAIINLVIAAGMGAAAFLLYLRRPSELAEQGVKVKPVRVIVQTVVALSGAMIGWLMFYGMSGMARGISEAEAWGVFGALLVGILSFGVMDIVMDMDFKAFFRHKVRMGVTMAAGLLLCFAFCHDWFGYDRYLPKENDIAEISVWMESAQNKNSYSGDFTSEEHPLQRVHIKDSAAAHAFLEEAVGTGKGKVYEDVADGEEVVARLERIYAKVTLKNGRVYYRRYLVSSADCDAAYALVKTKEYRDVNYAVPAEEVEGGVMIRLSRMGLTEAVPKDPTGSFARDICAAYRRDLDERADAVIKGSGRCFCKIYIGAHTLEVFEGMTHTREALRNGGYGSYADPLDTDDVEKIRLQLWSYYHESDFADLDLVAEAREVYGVFGGEDAREGGSQPTTEELPAGALLEGGFDSEQDQSGEGSRIALEITDPEEIGELLGRISYVSCRDNVFADRSVVDEIQLVDREGSKYRVGVYAGELPEKYIQRFGLLQKAVLEQK